MRAWIPLVLVACAVPGGGRWTPEAALSAHRERLDRNHDGVLAADDYAPMRWAGPPFATVDRNGDGRLDEAELARIIRGQSATLFDGGGGGVVRQDSGATTARPPTAAAEVLVFLRDRLVAAGATPPDTDAFAQAVASGRLDSAESLVVLAQMRRAWTLQGWVWPALGLAVPAEVTPAGAPPATPEVAPSPAGDPPR